MKSLEDLSEFNRNMLTSIINSWALEGFHRDYILVQKGEGVTFESIEEKLKEHFGAPWRPLNDTARAAELGRKPILPDGEFFNNDDVDYFALDLRDDDSDIVFIMLKDENKLASARLML